MVVTMKTEGKEADFVNALGLGIFTGVSAVAQWVKIPTAVASVTIEVTGSSITKAAALSKLIHSLAQERPNPQVQP